MKKLLSLLFFFATIHSFAQPWKFIGPSTGINNATEVDIEISVNGELYIAYIDTGNSNKVTVRRWNGTSWALVGGAGIGIANATEVQLITTSDLTPAFVAKCQRFDGTSNYDSFEIFEWNGTTWVDRNIFGYAVTDHQYELSLTSNTVGNLLFTFYSDYCQANNNYPTDLCFGGTEGGFISVNINTNTQIGEAIDFSSGDYSITKVSTKGSTGNNLVRAQTNYGMSINSEYSYFSGGFWNTSSLPGNEALQIKVERGTGSTVNSIVSRQDIATNKLYYQAYNGATAGTQLVIPTSSSATDFDFDTYYGNAYLFYKNGTTCYFKQITAGVSPSMGSTLGSGTTLAPSDATSLGCETYNGIHVIAYISGGKCYVKEYDLPASIEDYDNFVMCEGTPFNNSASNSIYLLDPNFDHSNISMTVSSQNVSVIPNSAVSVSGSGLGYSVFVTTTNDIASPTIVDLQFTLLENGTTIETTLLPITVNPKPTIVFTNTSSSICENAPPVNLNNQVTPTGGTWSGNGVLNNVFYPNYPTSSNVTLSYSRTNQYGCTAVDNTTITIAQTPDLNVSSTNSDCNQNTGTASVAITGGQSPYTTYWSSGSTQTAVSNLSPGQYVVTVTGANSCASSQPVMIGSTGFTQSATATPNICYGAAQGGVNLTVTGGTAPITFAWSNGATTEDIANVPSGPYEVTITDGQGCVSTGTYTVGGPTQIMLQNISMVSPNCGSSNGSISLTFTGGQTPYSYAWTDMGGSSVGTNNATLSNTTAGSFTCVMTDANGCSFTSTHALSNNNGPVIVVDTVINASCANDGQIQTSVIIGAPQTYAWSNGASTANLTGLAPGNYSCIITGASGCITTIDATVLSQSPIPVDICLVTVDTTSNTNLVVWEKPMTTSIDHFNIYRETSQAGLYQFVGSVLYSDESIYNDLVASPNVRSWRYKISSVDACGTESAQSVNHKTIHLVINQGLGQDINLSWDSYEGFPYGQFEVRRRTDLDGWNLIQTMPSSLFSFTDTPPTTDGLIYTVTVAAPGTCTSTKSAQDFNTTRSNRDNRLSTGNGTNGLESLLDASIEVYPNPANDLVVINNTSSYVITGKIIDASGRALETMQFAPGKQTVDISRLASGIYQLEITLDGIRTTKRLVISK
jgi:hypothetical protein